MQGYPTLLVLDGEGNKLDEIVGYVAAEALGRKLTRVLEKAGAGADPVARRILDRVDRELREAHDRMIEELRQIIREEIGKSAAPPPRRPPVLGISPDDFPESERKALGVAGGIKIGEVRGPAEKAGLRPGDILLRIGDTPATEETILATLSRYKPGDAVEVTLLRNRKEERLRVVLGERKE